MEVTVLTEQKKTAIELNNKIIFNASMAQDYLWEMCRALKEMKDTRLYKELGYSNFEDYCENEVGMKRANAYRYITIVEHINPENVSPVRQIGVKKLALLATLSDEQQKEVTEKVDLENTTYRELKAECDRLKKSYDSIQQELQQEKVKLTAIEDDKKRLERKLDKANKQITDLENRPVEVAIQEDEEGKMAKVLVKELDRKLSEADQEHVNAMENQRKKYQAQINSLEEQLEQAKNTSVETVKDDKEVFKAYYLTALNSFENLLNFVADCSNRDFYMEKTEKLLEICREKLGEI